VGLSAIRYPLQFFDQGGGGRGEGGGGGRQFSLVVLVVLEHDSPLLLPPPPLREVFPLVIFCCMDSQCGIDVTLPVLVGLHRVEF
jgi:hypothetical protein